MPPLTPSNQPNESQSTSKESSPVEFVDTLTPKEKRERIEEAVGEFLGENRKVVWGRRRKEMLQYVRVIGVNLDYDILRFCKRA